MAGRKCFDSVDSVGELFKDEVRRSRGTGAREHTVEEGASGSAWLGAGEGSPEQKAMSLAVLALEASTRSLKKCRIPTCAYRICIVTGFPGDSFAH